MHLLLCSVLLSACAQADSSVPKAPAMTTTTPTPTPPGTWPAPVQALLPALLDDAARRSGLPAEKLRVAPVQAVVWPDGSLGCPQPGRMYTQALVPGWRILVTVPDAPPLHYHASQRGGWLWCPAERATPALPASADPRR